MEFRSTIKKKIFAVNVFAVVLLLCIIAVAFNITVRAYMERETMNQLQRVASRTAEEINRGLFIFRRNDKIPSIVGSYLSLVRVARQPQLMANAEIAIIDRDNNVFIPEGLNAESASFDQGIVSHILSQLAKKGGNEVTLQYAGDDYAAIAVPVEGDFPVNISKIIFYTSLDNIELQRHHLIPCCFVICSHSCHHSVLLSVQKNIHTNYTALYLYPGLVGKAVQPYPYPR